MSDVTPPADEIVALVDEDGLLIGSAPRSVVRRDNLLHGATAVFVRDPQRRIYVHLRSDGKDWAPGRWDAAAGGVIADGEIPDRSAVRELAEELGVSGVAPTPLGRHLYADDTTRCVEYAYEVTWDGPIVHQPEEVADGRWMTLAELGDLLASGAPFVPDTRQLLGLLARKGVRDYAALA